MSTLCLTADDLIELTGRVRPSAQRRRLNALGIDVRGVRADGSLVVLRNVLDGTPKRGGKGDPEPDFEALTDVA